jgi:hypothetical protein
MRRADFKCLIVSTDLSGTPGRNHSRAENERSMRRYVHRGFNIQLGLEEPSLMKRTMHQVGFVPTAWPLEMVQGSKSAC